MKQNRGTWALQSRPCWQCLWSITGTLVRPTSWILTLVWDQKNTSAVVFHLTSFSRSHDFVSKLHPHFSRSLTNSSCEQLLQRGGCFAFKLSNPEQKSNRRKKKNWRETNKKGGWGRKWQNSQEDMKALQSNSNSGVVLFQIRCLNFH